MKYSKSVIPQMIRSRKISVFDLDMFLLDFADAVKAPLSDEFKDYGFVLKKFSIHTIVKPDEDPNYIKFKKLHYRRINDVTEAQIRQQVGVIDAQTAAQKKIIDAEAQAKKRQVEGYTYQQEKAFEVAEKIASNDAIAQMGNIGIGMGMMTGVGGPIGATVGNVVGDVVKSVSDISSAPNEATEGFCSHCGHKYKPGALFCEKCGTKLNRNVCANCGKELSGDSLFCPYCGTKIGGQDETNVI